MKFGSKNKHSININILECKLESIKIYIVRTKCININILECKFLYDGSIDNATFSY